MIARVLFPASVICVAIGLGLLLRDPPNPMALFEPGSFVTLALAMGLTGLLITPLAPLVKALVVAASMALCCQMPLFWMILAMFQSFAAAIYVSYLMTTALGAWVGGFVLRALGVKAASPVALIGAATHFMFIAVAAGLQHGTTRPPIMQDPAWIVLLALSWWLGWLMAGKACNPAD